MLFGNSLCQLTLKKKENDNFTRTKHYKEENLQNPLAITK